MTEICIDGQKLGKNYGSRSLFSDLRLSVFKGDRLGIMGQNGAGKSTLLRILAQQDEPDQGQVVWKKKLRLAFVAQSMDFEPEMSISTWLTNYYKSAGLYSDVDELVRQALVELGQPDQKLKNLSGGYQKRLSIIAELLKDPDILLLDEPTNHLDLRGILWLEQQLKRLETWVVVSHDRYFLSQTCDKIAEISPLYENGLLCYEGDYLGFCQKKSAYRAVLESRSQSLANQMRREDEWLSRGPKARGTKAKSRIEDAEELRDTLQQTRERLKTHESQLDFAASGRQTKKLIELKDLSVGYEATPLCYDLNLVIGPGMVLGVCGDNGCGKSTLLKTLMGDMPALKGRVEWARDLKLVYFDQQRQSLPGDLKVQAALCPSGDSVVFQGRSLHVNSWAQRFGLRYEQLSLYVRDLSGGERARLFIARLMLQVADVLVLDEPTNDLDIPTLEVLEQCLQGFPGAVILVSHDRHMMDRLCKQVVGFIPGEGARLYAGYQQWQNEFQKAIKPKAAIKPKRSKGDASKSNTPKVSYKIQYEFEHIEDKILEAEAEQSRLEALVAEGDMSPDTYQKLSEAGELVEALYQRWQELSALISGDS